MLERVLQVLEYPTVIDCLSKHAASSLGKEKVKQLKPSFKYEEVHFRQQATFEGTEVLRLKETVPFGGIRDIRPALKRSAVGSLLSPAELQDIASTISGARKLKLFLEALLEEHDWPIIKHWVEHIAELRHIERQINACFDEQGRMLDTASPALRRIRGQMRNAEGKIKDQLEQLTKSPAVQKMLQEPIVTIRNERYCLPVKAEYRPQFRGLVHDQSASGATLFIEPQSVIDINNELQETKLKEEKEIERILARLTASVAEEGEALNRNIQALAELDFIFAKAYFAQALKAVQPKINQRKYFRLKQARHPLIKPEKIVPVSFELGDAYTSLIITGPNTGGKTVTLKTIGLLTLMSCSGLFVPAEEGTEIAVVSSVYADIGDEQSIEQNLSTFSSHMTNIIRILENMDENSLVLLDELGAGTDPTEGAALAMAILDEVCQRGARVLATTHYSELKAYAYTKPKVMNASMEFDIDTLRPTYRLLVGLPGRSNALSIAQRLGLKASVIERAQAQIGQENTRVETMISSLEENRKRSEADRQQAERLRLEMEQLQKRLQQKEEQLEEERERIMHKAKEKARAYLAKRKKEADAIIAELRARQKSGQAVKEHLLIEAQKKLEQVEDKANDHPQQQTSWSRKQKRVPLHPGDEVFVHTFGQKGHIIEQTSETEYLVQLGLLKMKVNKDQLEKVAPSQKGQHTGKSTAPSGHISVKANAADTKMELDLRGKTIDEAIVELDQYIDKALLAGYEQIYIIHGKGTGQLRKGVQQYLKGHKRIKKTRLGGEGEGGSGVTVVQLD